MGLYESVGQKPLKDLLHEIHVGAARLPDFQRDFVWDPSGTISLILSLAQSFPAGSILRVSDTQNAFATRQFAGAPDLKTKHSVLVLDGQQRLTTLTLLLMYLRNEQISLSTSEDPNVQPLIQSTQFGKQNFNMNVEENRKVMWRLF